MFAEDNPRNYNAVIFLARLPGIGWSLLGLWIVGLWAGDLYGCRAALFAVVMWCFGPNVLAHASLSTPDLPCAVSCLAAAYTFHRYLLAPSAPAAYSAGVLLGLAQLTKFTALTDYAAWVALLVVANFSPALVAYRAMPLSRRVAHAALAAVTSVVVINVGYTCEGTWTPLGEFDFVSRTTSKPGVAGARTNRFSASWLGSVPVLLPANYVRGLDLQQADFEGKRKSYTSGEWRDRGWWYFYLYALVVKVPAGTLVLGGVGLALAFCPRFRRFDELVVWSPAVVIFIAASVKTGYTMHFRYVLPALPFMLVGLSKVAELRPAWCRVAVWMFAGSSVVSSLSVYPHSLSYFNEPAGGPDRGHEYLVDSNIDWGQDLFYFQKWAIKHSEIKSIGIAYFNFIDYRIVLKEEYGKVPPDPPSALGQMNPDQAVRYGPHPGWFAADIHNLMDPSGRCHYLMRHFKPVAKAGYSIWIFHITPEDADRVRREMGLPPLPPDKAAP
jgi:hypothetical protein